MKLIEISIENFRSITLIKAATVSSMQLLLGENNVGKSNVLYAMETLMSAGAGGVTESDFQDRSKPIIIRGKFHVTSAHLKKIWKPYMQNDELILEKHLTRTEDDRTKKISIEAEFHGYTAEPKQWFLSLEKITKDKGDKPKWKEIVEENSLPDYFLKDRRCTKAEFTKGLERYLTENEVEYDEPDMSATQALGFSSKAVANLPKLYLLRAETNYADETDKRSSTTTFRRLMADLTDRIIKNDPRYKKIEEALQVVSDLLNETPKKNEADEGRLASLSIIEEKIKDLLCKLMPSVERIKLKVVTDDVTTVFSKGVEITINDGYETEVLMKGHGLQRCVIFSLLQALIMNERNELVPTAGAKAAPRHPIILTIEEPELYIHPQLGKLFYDVLNSFAEKDQVIYTTHSPRFIDVYKYDSIAMVKKSKADGTKIINCDPIALNGLDDRKVFKGLTQLNSDVNELFFAKKVIVVEGPEDKVGITETLKKLGKIKLRAEEIDITTVVAGGKTAIPFFIRILNAFKMNYVVLHDLDIIVGMSADNLAVETKRNKAIIDLAGAARVVNFPIKLEMTLGLAKDHLKDQYEALAYFSDHTKINADLETIVVQTVAALG